MLNWLSSLWPTRRLPAVELKSPAALDTALTQERLRADRSKSTFAYVTLTPLESSCLERDLGTIAQILKGRLRATDVAGLHDPRRIGVILPETSSEGAWKLADDVCALFAAESTGIYCDVAMYPTPPGSNERNREAGEARQSSSRRVVPLESAFAQRISFTKRTLDIVGAVVAAVLFSPVLLAAAVAVKLTSPGPVLFQQRRYGFGGRPFMVLKLRTMFIDAEQRKAELLHLSEQDGPAFKLKNDPRITPIGRFLRKTAIDELPQLWNVLRGEMSLVGPRPMDCRELDQCSSWERRRLDVMPGLTCIWQVEGGSKVTFTEWMRMDLRYIRTRSLFQDVRLLVRTAVAVLFCRASH